jgi:hypothetical protein
MLRASTACVWLACIGSGRREYETTGEAERVDGSGGGLVEGAGGDGGAGAGDGAGVGAWVWVRG